jgi:predicted nucleic acid-binding protein
MSGWSRSTEPQDCVYLALARRLNAPLITADRRFAERAARHHGHVNLLGGPPATPH